VFRESGWLRSFWTKAILSAIIDAHHCDVMARTTSLTSEFYSGQANLACFSYFKLYYKQNEAKIINDFKG